MNARLSLKLGLVLFAVVAGALAIVYLAVVPPLESRLVGAKIGELERAAPAAARSIARTDPFRYFERVAELGAQMDARVVVYKRLGRTTLVPVADSRGLPSSDVQRDPVALEAARTLLPASGRVERGDRELAEAAVPADAETVVLLSVPLGDALANVQLVRRSLLAAGAVALLVSWLAGYLAASRFARRIARLETAAERIARGDFDEPVTDEGSDEITELARAFDRMRVRLADLEHVRREFIANASHELRTPLFSLAGFLELLTDEDVDEETRREFLLEARGQVERLTKLATDLLDLSRLDAGQVAVERREIDLAAAARAVVDELRVVPEAEDHELRVAAEEGVTALGDEQRIVEIGRILVENALRHTPPGTAVDVRAERREGQAALSVHDRGPGIREADREHLFERFYRGDGAKASGSGLGLAIARELAARMDGSIEVESRPGDTTFTLLLPSVGARFHGKRAEAAQMTASARGREPNAAGAAPSQGTTIRE